MRVALPLCDRALRLLGAAVVSLSIDGPVADRVKAELGSAREVIFYRGVEPSASTLFELLLVLPAQRPALPIRPQQTYLSVILARYSHSGRCCHLPVFYFPWH